MIASQPNGVRLVVFANILLWGLHIPILEQGLSLHLLVTILAGFLVGVRHQTFTRKFLLYIALLAMYGAITYLIGPCTDNGIKVVSSLIVMVITTASLKWTASAVRWDTPIITLKEASVLLGLITILATIEFFIMFFTGTPLGEIRAKGLYLEPSHLALSSVPLILYLWFCGSKKVRLWVAVTASVLLTVANSSTLVVMLAVSLLLPTIGKFYKRPNSSSAILGLFILGFILLTLLTISGATDILIRVNDIIDLRPDSNLSSLVYANGWQLIESYLNSTHGFGLGFNAMGCNPRAYTDITNWLELIQLGDQNFNDGSFLFSKFSSEFGIIGIVFFITLTAYTLKILFRLSSTQTAPSLVISVGWLTVATVGGFVRSGGGYFSGPVILAIFSVFILQTQHKRLAYHHRKFTAQQMHT